MRCRHRRRRRPRRRNWRSSPGARSSSGRVPRSRDRHPLVRTLRRAAQGVLHRLRRTAAVAEAAAHPRAQPAAAARAESSPSSTRSSSSPPSCSRRAHPLLGAAREHIGGLCSRRNRRRCAREGMYYMDLLVETVRDEIADCSEGMRLDRVAELRALLMLGSDAELGNTDARGWAVAPTASSPSAAAAASRCCCRARAHPETLSSRRSLSASSERATSTRTPA